MFQATAQSIIKKAPQQAARIKNAIRTVTTDSFAFYPVQSNRVRTVKQNSRNSFAFYPANVAERQIAMQSASINDAKAVRLALMKRKMAAKEPLKNWDSVMQALKTAKKTNTALP
jgi:hypothetical protein